MLVESHEVDGGVVAGSRRAIAWVAHRLLHDLWLNPPRAELPRLPCATRARVARGLRATLARFGVLAAIVAAVVALGACHGASATSASVHAAATRLVGGPVADYDLLDGVALHLETDEMAPDLRPTLHRLLGRRLVVANWTAPSRDPDEDPTETDGSLRWLRDYQPIYVRDENGRLTAVRYLSENPNRSLFQAPGAQTRARQVWVPTPGGGRWVRSVTLPLLHENGNLLVVGRRIIVSDKLIADNAVEHDEAHLVRLGYRARSEREVVKLLAKALRREVSDVVVLPPMPYESTEHVDVFLLPLDEHTVMVPRIENRAVARLRGQARFVAEDIQTFLDEQAATLTELGLTVPRWPMAPPGLAFSDADGEPISEADAEKTSGAEFELLVYSPANALLLNLAGDNDGHPTRVAVLPSFDLALSDRKLSRLSNQYTKLWQRELRQLGYTTSLVDSSDLVAYLGLIHCVSSPIPVN